MNDLEKNRIQRLENQVNILTQHLIQANHELAHLHCFLGELTSIDETSDWKRLGATIEGRIAALESLKPRQTQWR